MSLFTNPSSRLNPTEQQVFRTLYVEGNSQAQASAALRMSEVQIDALNTSVLRKLREA